MFLLDTNALSDLRRPDKVESCVGSVGAWRRLLKEVY